ncbi:MAG TPA: sugar-binding domain-containing protein [Candidatus Limnocylindrales bacterium]|nr:sugar-binding domain-containing protein [Candidatus Limnocylindrales bacterium]
MQERATSASDVQQLIQASRLYYELGETQSRVAEILGVTRPQVSRLLKRARAEGIVEIRIVDQAAVASTARDQLRDRFGLAAVHLAPTVAGPEEIGRRMVGRLGAEVLRAVIRDGAVVGIGDGASISAVADAVAADEPLHETGATVVPLCGGYWFTGPAREPFRRVADGIGGQALGLLAPGLVDDPATKRALVAHDGVRRIADLWDRLDVAAFGIGGPAWNVATLGRDIARELEHDGAVGEVLVSPFDDHGRFVCDALRARTIAFDARELAAGRVPVRIGVASGTTKVRPILGALRGGTLTALVTDQATAEAVVALADAEPVA